MPTHRRFVQSRLADLRDGEPRLTPEPRSPLLADPSGAVHAIEAGVISELGVRVETRYVLARGTDGRPHLWLRRQRVPRPPTTGQQLRFDVLSPDHRAGTTAPAPLLGLLLETTPVIETDLGNAETAASVSLTNATSRVLEGLVVHLVADRPDVVEPPLHAPIAVPSLSPGETRTFRIDATIRHGHRSSATTKLRALAWWPRTAHAPEVATVDVALGDATPGDLVLEAGAPVDTGPARRIPLTLRTTTPLGDADVEIQVRSQGAPGWFPVGLWEPGTPSPDGMVGHASLNWRQVAAPHEFRALVRSATRLQASAPVASDVLNPAEVPSPTIAVALSARDSRVQDDVVEVLAVVALTNEGDVDAEDVALTFEERLGAPDGYGWRTVAHELREPLVHVPAQGRASVAVVLRFARPLDPVTFVRVVATSAAWTLRARSQQAWSLPGWRS
ncbi:MAG: hypothetical protein AAGA48_35945 [Myxococcota bacterium]